MNNHSSNGSFPRATIEDLSVSRLIIGTNWFLGYSHTSKAKDNLIKTVQTKERIANILEVFFKHGVDTIYGVRPESSQLEEAIRDAEDRAGRQCIKMGTPHFDLSGSQEAEDHNRRVIDGFEDIGCRVCLPHQATTDTLVNRREKSIDRMETYAQLIRERGMIPGLSTHMPETIRYADETNLDVGTYIQICNAIGCYTPDEAREVIDISLSQLEQSASTIELQTTRSKASLT